MKLSTLFVSIAVAWCLIPSAVRAQQSPFAAVPGHEIPKVVRNGVPVTFECLYKDPDGKAPLETCYDFGDGLGHACTMIGTDFVKGVVLRFTHTYELPDGTFGTSAQSGFLVATSGNAWTHYNFYFKVERPTTARPVLPNPRALLGKWTGWGGPQEIEFLSDGTIILDGSVSGTYSILDGDKLKISDGRDIFLLSHVRVMAKEKIFATSPIQTIGSGIMYYEGGE